MWKFCLYCDEGLRGIEVMTSGWEPYRLLTQPLRGMRLASHELIVLIPTFFHKFHKDECSSLRLVNVSFYADSAYKVCENYLHSVRIYIQADWYYHALTNSVSSNFFLHKMNYCIDYICKQINIETNLTLFLKLFFLGRSQNNVKL